MLKTVDNQNEKIKDKQKEVLKSGMFDKKKFYILNLKICKNLILNFFFLDNA